MSIYYPLFIKHKSNQVNWSEKLTRAKENILLYSAAYISALIMANQVVFSNIVHCLRLKRN